MRMVPMAPPLPSRSEQFAVKPDKEADIPGPDVVAPKKRPGWTKRSLAKLVLVYLVFGGLLLALLAGVAWYGETYKGTLDIKDGIGGQVIGGILCLWLVSVLFFSGVIASKGKGGRFVRIAQFIAGLIGFPILAALGAGTAAVSAAYVNTHYFQPTVLANAPQAQGEQPSLLPPSPYAALVAPPFLSSLIKDQTRVALVIGNSRYAAVSQLPNPQRDADAVAASLRRLGFNTVRAENNLGADAMRRTLREFGAEASKADWAVVYYAGHGIEMNGQNYLIPVDARLATDRDVDLEAISLDTLLKSVDGARKLRVVILDACRENPFAATMARTMASRSISRGLGEIDPEGATLVVYAAKNGKVALDGNGANSPFVSALLHHIEDPGIEINRLFRIVRDEVKVATSSKQEPYTYGSLPAEYFYFKPPLEK